MTTKAYTLNLLIREVSTVPSTVTGLSSLADHISPIAGTNSAKINAIDTFLYGRLHQVLYGAGNYNNLGKTPRTRLVRALRARKNGNFA